MLNYPLMLRFRLLSFGPQVNVLDGQGNQVMYIKQKALALREDVKVFTDDKQTKQLYQIKANKIIDFSATYTISNADGSPLGSVKRKGMRSIWKATYLILDIQGNQVGLIREENPWMKILDAVLSQFPFLGMFVNPAYIIEFGGQPVLYLKKKPAVFEGKFELRKTGDLQESAEPLVVTSVIMALMLERIRG